MVQVIQPHHIQEIASDTGQFLSQKESQAKVPQYRMITFHCLCVKPDAGTDASVYNNALTPFDSFIDQVPTY